MNDLRNWEGRAVGVDHPLHTLEYETSTEGYGGPINVVLNGHEIPGVQQIEVTEETGQFYYRHDQDRLREG